MLRVGEVGVPVGEGQFLGFHEAVQVRRRVVAQTRQVEPLEQVQHLEGHEPLRVRRDLEDLDAPVGGADRLHPERVVGGQVLAGHEAALRFHEFVDGVGDRAPVEDPRPLLGDAPEGACQVRRAEDLAVLRRPLAVHQVGRRRRRMPPQFPRRRPPLLGDDLGHREPLFGVGDRRCEEFAERPGAEARREFVPAVERPGDGYDERPAPRHPVEAPGAHRLRGGLRAGPPGGVQAVEGPGLRLPVEREQVAADPAHHRLHHIQHRGGGEGGVHRVPAVAQDQQSGGGGQRLAGGDHPVPGEHRRPPQPGVVRRPIRGLCGGRRGGGDSEHHEHEGKREEDGRPANARRESAGPADRQGGDGNGFHGGAPPPNPTRRPFRRSAAAPRAAAPPQIASAAAPRSRGG